MNNKKPVITYIKNGQEKTLKVTSRNSNKIKKEIFSFNDSGIVVLKKNIDFIHFQNINFPLFINKEDVFRGIESKYHTICILENCELKNKLNNKVISIELTSGTFQLINIETNEFKTGINLNSYKEIIIDNTNLKSNNSNLLLDSFHSFQKLDIKDNNTIKKMYLSGEEIVLSRKFLLNDLSLNSDGIIKLGTDTTNTIINISSKGKSNIVIESNELELNNCNIINDNPDSNIYINYKKIIGNNFIIKSKGNIIINNKVVFKEKNKEGYVVVTIKDLLRLKLNNILSTKLNQIENRIVLDTEEKLLENYNEKLESNIKYQEKLVEYNINILKELREELVNWNKEQRSNLVKSLKNNPVSNYR